MHRSFGRVSLWSAVDKLTGCKHGRGNVNELGFFRTITTSFGHHVFNCEVALTTKSIQEQIVDALCRGERSRASELLLKFGHGNHSLKPKDFVNILKHCAESPDPLFVMETWQIMEEKEVGLDNICYLLMIRALCEGGYLEEASKLINFIGESHGIYPTLPAYNTFLGTCSKMGSVIHANQCLDLMDRSMVGKNEVTYSELLKLVVQQQNLSAVSEIWKDYIKHYSPSFFALRKFIWAFTRLRDLKSAYETLQRMVALAIQENSSVNISPKGFPYPSRLDIPILLNGEMGLQQYELKNNERSVPSTANAFSTQKKGKKTANAFSTQEKGEKTANAFSTQKTRKKPATAFSIQKKEIKGIVRSMPVMHALMMSFNDVMYACAKAKNFELAERLLLQMQNLGLEPSSYTYDAFVRAVVPVRGFIKGMKVLKTMRHKNLKPSDPTLAAISMSCSSALKLGLAEALLEQISNCPHMLPYNAFLTACYKMNQPERALRMLAKMKQSKLQLDIRTYELLFSLFVNVNAPYEKGNMSSHEDSATRLRAIEMDMARNGVQHSQESIKNLLKALGTEGKIKELVQYLHVAEDLFFHSDSTSQTPIYNTALHSLVEAKECRVAFELFKAMKSVGFEPDAATYNIMIDCCVTLRSYKTACALVSLMLRDGFCPQAVTYAALIKILLSYGRFQFKQALDLLDRASSEEFEHDVLLYNPILHRAKEKRRIDIIERIVEQMHRKKIQPDITTCHNVFRAYVKCGFHSMGIEALQVLSMRMISLDDSFLRKKAGKFEEHYIFPTKKAEQRILEFVIGYEDRTAAALLNLRWCAVLGFEISWAPNETAWAKRLAANYDSNEKVPRRGFANLRDAAPTVIKKTKTKQRSEKGQQIWSGATKDKGQQDICSGGTKEKGQQIWYRGT